MWNTIKKYRSGKMSHQLPMDCVYSVLACVPLEQFAEHNPSDKLWNARFQFRHSEPLRGGKKLYLLRAATEYQEVCTDTVSLYKNSQYQNLIYYLAARGGNWELLRNPFINKLRSIEFTYEIMCLAINAHQTDTAKYIFEAVFTGGIATCITYNIELLRNDEFVEYLYAKRLLAEIWDTKVFKQFGRYLVNYISFDKYLELFLQDKGETQHGFFFPFRVTWIISKNWIIFSILSLGVFIMKYFTINQQYRLIAIQHRQFTF